MIKTPILLLIYNRPNLTEKMFQSVREARPTDLYVAADGPKSGSEADSEKCRATREITENIDWKCNVHRLYRKENLGLKASVYGAVSWFFENVSEGIILEDDCVPDNSFYLFCEEMLDKYRDDEEVMHIGGSNFLSNNMQKKDSYYFSKYSQVWGWATWKRAWKKMDYQMHRWNDFIKSDEYIVNFPYLWERIYWQIMSSAVMKEKINSWAYRWQFSIWENNSKTISPGINLVKNIGLGSGTHINTNISVLGKDATSISKNPVLLGDEYSLKADKHTMKNEYRISPLMDMAQWAFYLLK